MYDPIDRYLLENDPARLQTDLMNVTCVLQMDEGAHVPDTLTRIRVLPTVAVVGQKSKVNRPSAGAASLEIYIKFLPDKGGTYSNLKSLGKMVKSLPGVRTVKYLTVSGRKVLFKGKALVI
tara:strand:- start:1343 stop:1705 length:363 start_codon:yes stop_codon:yes gene_type:complete